MFIGQSLGAFGILGIVSAISWIAFAVWAYRTQAGWRPPVLVLFLLVAVLTAGYRSSTMLREATMERVKSVLANTAPICLSLVIDPVSKARGSADNHRFIEEWVKSNSIVSGVSVLRRTPDEIWEYVYKTESSLGRESVLNDDFLSAAAASDETKSPVKGLQKAWDGTPNFVLRTDQNDNPLWYSWLVPIKGTDGQVDSIMVVFSPSNAWNQDYAAGQTTSVTLTAVTVLLVLSCAVVVTQLGVSLTTLRVTKAEAALQQEQIRQHMQLISEKNMQMAENQARLSEAYAQLRALATTDGLTGVLNHRALMDFLTTAMGADQGFASPCSVILLDVDNFKMLNDQFGHQSGDDALRVLASVLAHSAPPGCGVGRYGGEEFMVVVPGASESTATAIAEELRRRVQIAKTSSRGITVSIGVSTVYSRSKSEQKLIDEADQAMYHSKRTGKNRVTHFGRGVVEVAS